VALFEREKPLGGKFLRFSHGINCPLWAGLFKNHMNFEP
jgi:hypothetical protein